MFSISREAYARLLYELGGDGGMPAASAIANDHSEL
jgi:hypothetical protein